MDISTFEDRLDLYGSDISLWPAAERDAAAALVASSTQARGMLSDMAEVEVVLRRPSASSSAGVIDATVARATRSRQESRMRLLGLRAGWGAAAAAVLALGLLFGSMSPPSSSQNPERIVAAALGSGSVADVE